MLKGYGNMVRRRVLATTLIAIVFIVLLVIALSNRSDDSLFAQARNSDEAEAILVEIFTPSITTAVEVKSYLSETEATCNEVDGIDYDSETGVNLHDSLIYCSFPAPNTEAAAKLRWFDYLFVKYYYRAVFYFDGNDLSDMTVMLIDIAL